MKQSDLRPARDFVMRYGVKSLCFGAAGTGKTPIADTAPRGILLAIEPGLNSMSNSNLPTWCAPSADKIQEFFKWLTESSEAKNFDTVIIDSVPEMALQFLWEGERKHRDGRAAYGHMADALVGAVDKPGEGLLTKLFYMQNKHTYLICKQELIEMSSGLGQPVTYRAIPSFPGKVLPVAVPHMYDLIMHLGDKHVPFQLPPGVTNPVRAFQTKGTNEILARDRSGQLDGFEFPNLAAIFAKAMR